MRINVRGQLGVQILQTAVGIADLKDGDEPIVCVNTESVGPNFHARFSELFNYNIRIINVPGMQKTPYWVPGAATKAFENRHKFLKHFHLKGYEIHNREVAIHIRGGDKPIATASSYSNFILETTIRQESCRIYGNDEKLMNQVSKETTFPMVVDNPELDWFNIFYSDRIISAPNAFIMSMMLLNPDINITFMHRGKCDGGYPSVDSDFVFLNEALQFCPNVKVV